MSCPGDEEVDERTAEIGAFYVDPHHWREGVGNALLPAALAELSGNGWCDMVLWVLPENRPALAFYDRFGFAVEPESKSWRNAAREALSRWLIAGQSGP